MSTLRGIILYDIQLNGNLNGVYTNNHMLTNGRLFTETAMLVSVTINDNNIETRIYDCFYFDAESGRVNATLMLRIENGIITARWWIEGQDVDIDRPAFVGEGYQMNQRQIAIAYTD